MTREKTGGSFQNLLDAFQTMSVPLTGHDAHERAAQHGVEAKALIHQQFSDSAWRHMMEHAHAAAVRGEHEYLLLRTPASTCSDHGRAILQQEPGWPETLSGDAASVHHHWRTELQPQGFTLEARVIDFPGGMPGEVGLFLGWRKQKTA